MKALENWLGFFSCPTLLGGAANACPGFAPCRFLYILGSGSVDPDLSARLSQFLSSYRKGNRHARLASFHLVCRWWRGDGHWNMVDALYGHDVVSLAGAGAIRLAHFVALSNHCHCGFGRRVDCREPGNH